MHTTTIYTPQQVSLPSGNCFKFLSLHHYQGKVRRSFPYHLHDYYEVSFTFRGGTLLNVNGDLHPFRSGDLCLIAPQSIHAMVLPDDSLFSLDSEEDDIYEIDFQINTPEAASLLYERQACIVPMGDYADWLCQTLSFLMQHAQEHTLSEDLPRSLLVAVFEVLRVKSASHDAVLIEDTSDNYTRDILLYIHDHYRENPSLDFLCRRFSVSKSHLIRLFQQNFKTSPVNYRIEQQISTACSLLLSSEKTVAEIAEWLGYENTSFFSATFSRRMNTTPQKFRARYQETLSLQYDDYGLK
ncbi:MAG: AraC family transcriptional regulator [Lachnospiraceae bacterium]|nr:AraC family transcriptional regulator [Lachnospiraceae bacterium]